MNKYRYYVVYTFRTEVSSGEGWVIIDRENPITHPKHIEGIIATIKQSSSLHDRDGVVITNYIRMENE